MTKQVRTIPDPAGDLGPSGRALWHSVVDTFDLAEHERVQLRQACAVADVIDSLAATVAREGAAVMDPLTKSSKPHPCVTEMRMQRVTLARLLAALRVPDSDGKPQSRRAGMRAPYDMGGTS